MKLTASDKHAHAHTHTNTHAVSLVSDMGIEMEMHAVSPATSPCNDNYSDNDDNGGHLTRA